MLNKKALDTFGRADQHITDAYIVWALTFDEKNTYQVLKIEFDNLEKISLESSDPYFLALYSAALSNVGNNLEALAISKTTTKL